VEIGLAHPDGRTENLAVKIPAGIDEGQTIRLRGKGGESPGAGQPGDMLITIHVAPHPLYQRSGKNLLLKLPVTLAEAALGAKVDVPLPSGKKVSLRVPAGTSSGKKLRIKGQGVAPAKGEPGDLLAEVQIMIPSQLDEESQSLVRRFDERNPLEPRGDL
jgi:DnaJ-class molecular chaperone